MNMMMKGRLQNRSIEIHDSKLERITIDNGAAVLHFPHVYIHSCNGRPGIDAGTGWTQEATLRIEDAEITGQFRPESREAYGDDIYHLSDGQIELNGTRFDNEIPIPLDVQGTVKLELDCWGEVIRVHGTAAKLELMGTAVYVEEFRP